MPNGDNKYTWLDERIYENVRPVGYSDIAENITSAIGNIISGSGRRQASPKREELWKYVLGSQDTLSQFEQSQYKPSISEDENAKYLAPKGYNRQKFLNEALQTLKSEDSDKAVLDTRSVPLENLSFSGDITIGKGKDDQGKYISFYDVWDLNNPIANAFLDKNPEIYDRVYYRENPKYKRVEEINKRLEQLRNNPNFETRDNKLWYEYTDLLQERANLGWGDKEKYIPSQQHKMSIEMNQQKKEMGGSKMSNGNIYGAIGQAGGSVFDQLASQYDEETQANVGLDIASGVASGAGMGAALGPIGAAGGAVVGGLTSLISSQKEKEEAKEMKEKQEYLQRLKSFKKEQAQRPDVNYQPVFQMGGGLPIDNTSYQTSELNLRRPDFYQDYPSLPGDQSQLHFEGQQKPQTWPGNWRTKTVEGLKNYLNRTGYMGINEFNRLYNKKDQKGKRTEFINRLKQIEKEEPFKFKVSQTSLKEPTMQVNMLSPDKKFKYGGKKQQGGPLLEEFNGPKHENGGIDINIAEVEGGETEFDPMDYIFSDTLKVPGENKTFAEVSKKLKNKYGDRDNRFVNKALKRELSDLMKKQEEKKANRIEKKNKNKKMQEGGFLSGENTGLDILSLAPAAMTVGMTLGDILSEPVDPDLPRMRDQAYEPQLIDYRPRFREIERTFGQRQAALTRGARTPGQFMAGQIQSATEEARAKGEAMQQIQEANRQQRARAEYMDYQQDIQNLQQATEEQRLRMQAEAQRRNAIRQGLASLGTQAGQIAGDIRQQQAQERAHERFMDILGSMFPDVKVTESGVQTDLQQPVSQQNYFSDQTEDIPLESWMSDEQFFQID